jgi:hypothetical protein
MSETMWLGRDMGEKSCSRRRFAGASTAAFGATDSAVYPTDVAMESGLTAVDRTSVVLNYKRLIQQVFQQHEQRLGVDPERTLAGF